MLQAELFDVDIFLTHHLNCVAVPGAEVYYYAIL